MDLKQLVKETKAMKKLAEEEPGSHPQTHAVKLGKIRRAKENLKELFLSYKAEIKKRIVFILVSGPGAEEFHRLSTSEEFGCFSADTDGVYKDTIKNVNPRLYTDHPFSPDVLSTVENYFQDVADYIGVLSYPQMIYKNRYAKTVKDKEEFLESVKQAINEDIGAEIVGHYIVQKITEQALEEDFTGKIVPVVLTTKDSKLIEELDLKLRQMSRNVFAVETTEEVTAESVEKELKNIRKAMKNAV